MTRALALPRSRRKRLKPPPPSLWLALFWVAWDVLGAVYCLVVADGPFSKVCAAFLLAVLVFVAWPKFTAEWRAWRDGS